MPLQRGHQPFIVCFYCTLLFLHIFSAFIFYSSNVPIPCTTKAASHATRHWKATTHRAQPAPSSRFTALMAATQGVYSRQKVKREAAARGVSTFSASEFVPNSTPRVDTTLSLAIKPEIRAVEIRQSPKPSGAKTGASSPAMAASMLSEEFSTISRRKSKVCKNQITTHATKITVKARSRKSLAFSHRSCMTFRIPGMR